MMYLQQDFRITSYRDSDAVEGCLRSVLHEKPFRDTLSRGSRFAFRRAFLITMMQLWKSLLIKR